MSISNNTQVTTSKVAVEPRANTLKDFWYRKPN